MTVTSKDVFVGAPDQSVTGAVLVGPETDTIPAFIDDFDDTGLDDSGYIGSDGIKITPSDSTESITDWSGAEVRRILTGFTGAVVIPFLALDEFAAKAYFGAEQVTVEAADATHGKRMRMALGKHELPTQGWYFKVKDGNRAVLVMLPHGQVTSRDEIDLSASSAIALSATIACYPDSTGNSIYIFTDDGVFSDAS